MGGLCKQIFRQTPRARELEDIAGELQKADFCISHDFVTSKTPWLCAWSVVIAGSSHELVAVVVVVVVVVVVIIVVY